MIKSKFEMNKIRVGKCENAVRNKEHACQYWRDGDEVISTTHSIDVTFTLHIFY